MRLDLLLIKAGIKHYNIIRWYHIFYAWPTFWPQ